MLILVCGLPGSGKSSFSKKLLKKISPEPVYLNSDILRKEIIKNPKYSSEERGKVYDELADRAQKALASNNTVIVDATFNQANERKHFLELGKAIGTEVHILFCVLSEAETKKRIMKRKNSPSEADFGVYLKIKAEFEPIKEKHLVLDSSLPLKERLRATLEFIGVH